MPSSKQFRSALERCPPELSADLVDRGFVLAGGGGLLRGIDQLLRADWTTCYNR